MAAPMDTELIRFRIDPQVRDKAEAVCSRLGYELRDVLQATVARIARDNVLPFELGADAAPAPAAAVPFHDYNDRLWAGIRPQVDAEVALAVLMRFIALCSTRLDEQSDAPQPDAPLVARLTRQREEARRLRLELDVSNAAAVRAVLETYGPLVRAAGG